MEQLSDARTKRWTGHFKDLRSVDDFKNEKNWNNLDGRGGLWRYQFPTNQMTCNLVDKYKGEKEKVFPSCPLHISLAFKKLLYMDNLGDLLKSHFRKFLFHIPCPIAVD